MAVLLGADEGDGLFWMVRCLWESDEDHFWENNFINYARETIC